MSADTDTLAWRAVEDLDASGYPAMAKAGGQRVVIFDTGKGLRATEPTCPHLKAGMANGILMANGSMVRCPKHNFIFRLGDGKGVNCVGLQLKVYEVRAGEGGLEVLL